MNVFYKKNKKEKKEKKLLNNKIAKRFNKTEKGKKYKIDKIVYEKNIKGVYIIKKISTKDELKYILKFRNYPQTNNGNIFEKDICDILAYQYNKNIIQFIYSYENTKFHYFIYEYFEGCDLVQFIKKNKCNEILLKSIIYQIVNGVHFLHYNNILHCDLKLDNLILNNKGELKIIDFDLAIICNDEDGYISDYIFGTMQYIAPESYDLCIYSKKTDVWQIGIILFILISYQYPHKTEITIINSFSNLYRQNFFKHIDMNIAKNAIIKKKFDMSLFYLLDGMLAFNDSERFSIKEILDCQWINKS
jgi:serine/threonine protein kinase